MSLIKMAKLQGHSDDLTEQQIIKEFLVRESNKLCHEINRTMARAKCEGVSLHGIAFLRYKLEERKNFLNHLLDLAVIDCLNIEKEKKK